ncbi:MAG: ImpA family type VI secretion system protein, partial [Betaproteobacteria bacterium]
LEPISAASPTGADLVDTQEFMVLSMLVDYLVESARAASGAVDVPDDASEDERRHAELEQQERKRLLAEREANLRGVLGAGKSVNRSSAIDEILRRSEQMIRTASKDLRIAQCAAIGLLARDGVTGLADGMRLIAGLLERFPEGVFPLPDPADPEDVSERGGVVVELTAGDGCLALLRPQVVLDGGRAGRITLGSLGEPADGIDEGALAESMQAAGAAAVESAHARLREACVAIDAVLDRFAPGALSFGRSGEPRVRQLLERAASRLLGFGPSGEAPADAGAVEADGGRVSGLGPLNTREDARRMIQQVCAFLERSEPSHPAPLLLRRAERLLGLSFYDIVKDLAPNAVGEIDRLAGRQDQ